MKKTILILFFLLAAIYAGYSLYQTGYHNGYSTAYAEEKDTWYAEGKSQGRDEGYQTGTADGYKDGLDEGYKAGFLEANGEKGPAVYYTRSGGYYHRKTCTYLKDQEILFTSIAGAKEQGLMACDVCRPPEE